MLDCKTLVATCNLTLTAIKNTKCTTSITNNLVVQVEQLVWCGSVGEGLVWLIGAVVCVVAAALRCSTIGSCQSTATSCDCTERLVAASPRK